MENRVNIFYLTTKCNLECDYCYEEASRKNLPDQVTLDEKGIDKYLYEIANREGDTTSTVVIMGGEPFLKPYLLYYTIKKMGEIDHRWGTSITTNGTFLGSKLIIVKKILEVRKPNTSLTFEISYDASGHFRRKYRDSILDSKEKVENTINNFIKNKIPFKISYTLHKDNYKNFTKDMIYILEKFGTEYLTDIKISIYCQELADNFGGDYKKAVNKLKPYANALTRKYGIPICDLTCGVTCFKCDKSKFVGKSYCGPEGINYEELETEKAFDCWGKDE